MEKDIPLPYHDALVKVVKRYETKPLPAVFAEFDSFVEDELLKRGIPLEMKYLPMALTDHKINYLSDDRSGLWALPVLVGLHYGLTIDDKHDERFAMEAATGAALDYLSDLHQQYNDWWLSILAYYNSPNSVNRALILKDNDVALWDFYDQGLVPDAQIIAHFIACIYVYNDYQTTSKPSDDYVDFSFSRPIALKLLAKEAGLTVNKIKELNPVFRSDTLVPFKDYTLRLPKKFANYFPDIEQELYDKTAAASTKKTIEPTETKPVSQNSGNTSASPSSKQTYIVKKGDTLTKIANKYHTTVTNLKKWNRLKSDQIREGQKLIVKP